MPNRTNALSMWRLHSIVQTRAATFPTFDPTWYGPTAIVLCSIEVSLACICASLPVFWPVLKKMLDPYIIVTHEVKITRESLRADEFGDSMELRRSESPESAVQDDDFLRLASLPELQMGHPVVYRNPARPSQDWNVLGFEKTCHVQCRAQRGDGQDREKVVAV